MKCSRFFSVALRHWRVAAVLGFICIGISNTFASGSPDPVSSVQLSMEQGFLGVIDHRIQFDKKGTYFDYRKSGGQDILFAFSRFGMDMRVGTRHIFVLLYQPLKLETTASVRDSLVVDRQVFEPGTPMRFVYAFPFYRVSWMYDFSRSKATMLGAGISLQIRNARIVFESLDGTRYRDNRDIGPVPVLKFHARHHFDNGFYCGAEADGFYAPVSYLNGSDEEVVGAILDAAVRTGVGVMDGRGSLNLTLRYLGGGAVGTNTDDVGPGDGYVKNWLHFFTVTLGSRIRLGG